MIGCTTCTPAEPMAVELYNAIKKATDHAREKKETTAVYQDSTGYHIAEAFFAFSQGYPVIRVIAK